MCELGFWGLQTESEEEATNTADKSESTTIPELFTSFFRSMQRKLFC